MPCGRGGRSRSELRGKGGKGSILADVPEAFTFEVGARGRAMANVHRADEPIGVTLVLAHGAGASQKHPFMLDIARRLNRRGVDVVTFDFLYMGLGKKLPDRNETLEATWRAAIEDVRERDGMGRAPLFIGGKSMGGRIASQVAAAEGASRVSGVVLLGYPLHRLVELDAAVAAHLPLVPVPMLFVQGTRDELGPAKEIAAVARRLRRARVHVVEGGDHSLALRKRDGVAAQQRALERAADAITSFVKKP